MNNNTVKQVVKLLCTVAGYGALLMIPHVVRIECTAGERERSVAGYYDAIQAIMNTSMFASDKREIISAMKRDGSAEYYKAVIGIVNTSMFASDKIATIKALH